MLIVGKVCTYFYLAGFTELLSSLGIGYLLITRFVPLETTGIGKNMQQSTRKT